MKTCLQSAQTAANGATAIQPLSSTDTNQRRPTELPMSFYHCFFFFQFYNGLLMPNANENTLFFIVKANSVVGHERGLKKGEC